MLKGLGEGWTASFLAKVYPRLSRYLIRELLQDSSRTLSLSNSGTLPEQIRENVKNSTGS